MLKVVQHRFNILHIYCRMRDLGIGKKEACWLCRKLEKLVNLFIY